MSNEHTFSFNSENSDIEDDIPDESEDTLNQRMRSFEVKSKKEAEKPGLLEFVQKKKPKTNLENLSEEISQLVAENEDLENNYKSIRHSLNVKYYELLTEKQQLSEILTEYESKQKEEASEHQELQNLLNQKNQTLSELQKDLTEYYMKKDALEKQLDELRNSTSEETQKYSALIKEAEDKLNKEQELYSQNLERKAKLQEKLKQLTQDNS